MLHLVVATAFEDMKEADNIAVYIGMGIIQGVAHACLSCQIDHGIGLGVGKKLLHAGAIAQIHLEKLEIGVILDLCQAIALQLHAVVGIKIVDADHRFALLEQHFCQTVPNKASSSRDKNTIHVLT